MEYLSLANSQNEKLLGAVVAVGVALGLVYRWFFSVELPPDPWEQNREAESDQDDEEPICQRCLRPISLLDRGCNHCGAITSPVAAFTPFPAYLNLGDAMRAGVFQRHPRRIVAVGGAVLGGIGALWLGAGILYWPNCLLTATLGLSETTVAYLMLGESFLLAAAYVFFFLRNRRRANAS